MNDRMQENDRTAQDPFQSWSLTFMLFAVLFATLGSLALYVISSPELRKLSRFGRALNTTLSRYSGELNGQDFYENGAVELYRLLDRYSGYAPKERYEQIYEEFSGSYAGLGVTIIARPQGLLVASVNEAGPSRPAGLLLGDIIISADSVSLVGLNTRDASLILRGEPGAELEIKALRPSGSAPLAVADSTLPLAAFPFDTLTFRITRAHVPLQHIRFAGITGNRALYIRLDDFGAGAFEQFAGIFDSLTEIEPEYSGVLIDLRDNPGGLLGEALDMTDFFLEKDVLMLGRVGRSRWSRREISSSGDDETGGAPTLILVNGSSASASEVFSGALKFASRARLVGDTTYGKGLVQEYNTLSDGSASRLSAARYYFTGQRYLNEPGAEKKDSGSGLAPDYAYDFSDANGFVRALEARVMLVPFAARYQDWIISSYDKGEYRDVITELENFVRLSGFIYESESLDRATNLFVTSKLKGVDSESRELVESILRRARNVEKNMFTRNSEKIMRRLARLAYERREGARAAFLAVDLLHDPDLKYCERLLLDSLRNGS